MDRQQIIARLRENEAALRAIDSALQLMRDTTRAHGHREDADYAFHIAIAEAANNYFFLSSMQALKDHINVGMKLHGLSLLGPAGGLLHEGGDGPRVEASKRKPFHSFAPSQVGQNLDQRVVVDQFGVPVGAHHLRGPPLLSCQQKAGRLGGKASRQAYQARRTLG